LAQNRQQLEIDLRLNVDSLNQGIKQAKGDFQSYITSIKTALANLPDGRSALGKEFKAAKQEAQELLKTLRELSKSKNVTQQQSLGAASQVQTFGKNLANTTDRALLEQNKADIRQMTLAQKQAYATTIQDDTRYRKELQYTQQLIREEYKKTEQANKAVQAAEKQKLTEQNKIIQQTEEMVNRSITLRYALYDVASSLQSASTAMLNYGRAVFGAAIAQEKAFSQIEKTQIDVPQQQLEALKKELVDLSTQIPRTFEELTSIGMLGAQLGIATSDIAKFTEVVAKFSTITGVTVEETALAFGRLASLLKVPAGEFENLGASIAQVGVNGASTEQQILSTAKQIGAVGNAAGFTAAEVVGLASSLASLGVAPEEARGVLIPTFQQINRAVRSFNQSTKQGNESLKIFSEIAGVSAEEFTNLWSDKTSGGAFDVFQKFVVGLGNTDISKSLSRLGLDGIRTSKGLTALGNNAETMGNQVREALEGFGQATFLDESFAVTLDDISSKLQMTQSAFEALLASFAGDETVLAGFGVLLDLVTMLANKLREISEGSRVGSLILGVVSAATVALGLILQLVSAVAIAAGGFLALRVAAVTALNNPATNSGLVTMIAGLVGVRTAATTAAPAVAGVGVAGTAAGAGLNATAVGATRAAIALRTLMASTGVGALVVLLGIALEKTINLLFPIEDAAAGAGDGLNDFGDEADGAAKDTSTLRSELDELLTLFNQTALAPYKTEKALYDLGNAMKSNGKDFSAFTEGGRTNMDALAGVVEGLKNQANGDAEETYNLIWGFMLALESQGIMTAEAYTYLNGVMVQFAGLAGGIGSMMPVEFDLTSFLAGLKGNLDSAGGAVDTLADKVDRLFAKLDQRVSLMSSLDKLKESLIDNGASFSVFSESGRNNIGALRSTIDQLAEASGNNKKKFSSDLNALKIAMVQAGVDGGRALAIINKAIKSTGVNAKASRDSVRDFAAALNTLDEQRVVGVANAIERLSGSVMEYLNARWMLANTQLEIAAGWEDIANSTRGARDEIEDISAELASFAAQRGTLEYQLDIALKYGDTLRANELRAQIAELNQSEAEAIANNQQQQEQEDPIAQLLEQQRALQAMLQSYVEIGSAEVISARNKREAKEAINGIVVEFENQARAAGVSEANVIKYSAELRAALKLARELAKPAKYKIDADTKAALDQIKDFASSAKAQINSIPRTVTVSVNYVTTGTPAGTRSGPAVVTTDKPKTKKAMGGLITASNGGFITGPGTGTSDSIPALLSDGEFVIRAAAVASYGLDFMNSLNNINVRPAVTGFGQVAQASSETMVYLSPEDRLLLRQAIDRPINLYTENARIAQSANSGNVLLAQRGQN
jgi:TP901 family phage tail tape measure protein